MSEEQESLLEFPCLIDIKAMGRAEDGFEEMVVEIVRRHSPEVGDQDVSRRLSAKGNYISVTVNIMATSKQQLDAIYRDLHGTGRLLYAL